MSDPLTTPESPKSVVLWLAEVMTAPWLDAETLFGAALGACLVISRQQHFTGRQTVCRFLMSGGVGTLFAPLLVVYAPEVTTGIAAFICALVIIPLSVKLMQWLDRLEINELLKRLKGRQ